MANDLTKERLRRVDGFTGPVVKPYDIASNTLLLIFKNLLFWGSIAISLGFLALLI